MTEENQTSVDESETNWDNLEAQAAEVDNILMPPTSSLNQTEPAEPEIQTGELLTQAFQVIADVFAPNWELKKEESEQLGAVYGALIDKHLPDSGVEKYGLEITAVLVTGMIVKSRKGIPLRKPEKEVNESQPEKPKEKTVNDIDASHQNVKSGVLAPKGVKHG